MQHLHALGMALMVAGAAAFATVRGPVIDVNAESVAASATCDSLPGMVNLTAQKTIKWCYQYADAGGDCESAYVAANRDPAISKPCVLSGGNCVAGKTLLDCRVESSIQGATETVEFEWVDGGVDTECSALPDPELASARLWVGNGYSVEQCQALCDGVPGCAALASVKMSPNGCYLYFYEAAACTTHCSTIDSDDHTPSACTEYYCEPGAKTGSINEYIATSADGGKHCYTRQAAE